MVGNIPETITIFSGLPETIKFEFDDLQNLKKGIADEQIVYPAFPSDASNKKTCETGLEWAERYCRQYDKITRSYSKACDPRIDTHKNDPVKGIKIVNLEIRGNGGRAYKVVTPVDNYYFDLREDILLDLMINEGVSPGGILNGEYVWGRVGSQMKLVRVGSKLYDNLSIASCEAKLPKLKEKDLIVGHMYSSKSGKTKVFLGRVDYIDITYSSNGSRVSNGYYGSSLNSGKKSNFYIDKINKVENAFAWIEIHNYNNNDNKKNINWKRISDCHIEYTSSFSVIKDEGKLDGFPSGDLIFELQNNGMTLFKKYLQSYRYDFGKPNSHTGMLTYQYSQKDIDEMYINWLFYSKMINISKPGSGFPLFSEYVKWGVDMKMDPIKIP